VSFSCLQFKKITPITFGPHCVLNWLKVRARY
jgi:hypothetical protein